MNNHSEIDVLIIRGAPGVGKSTAASHIKKYCPKGVTIETDCVRAMVNNTSWTDTEEHISAVSASSRLILSYLSHDYRPIVLVDTLSGGTLKFITDNLKTTPYKVISLLASHNELKKRIKKRQEGFKDIKTSIWVNDDILKSVEPFEYKIDTTNMTEDAVISTILDKCRNV